MKTLLFLFVLNFFSATGLAAGFGGTLATGGDLWPALLAEVSAHELGQSALVGNWWILAIIAILQLLQFFKPSPPLHRLYADKDEMKEQFKNLEETLRRWSTDHYKARGRMYRRINALENALSFLVGKMARANDPDAERMEKLLEKAENAGEDDE